MLSVLLRIGCPADIIAIAPGRDGEFLSQEIHRGLSRHERLLGLSGTFSLAAPLPIFRALAPRPRPFDRRPLLRGRTFCRGDALAVEVRTSYA